MDTILTDLADAAIVRSIEANTIEFLLALGRAGGGEEKAAPRLHWIVGGSPLAYHNCVVRADLSPDEVDAAIAASIAAFRAHGVPGSWHLGPSARPAELGDRLVAHGFVPGEEPGMAVDLRTLVAVPEPTGLRIGRVRDTTALDNWTAVLARGFGEGEREATWVAAMYRRLGYGETSAWRHYLAWLDGEPVGTATLFLAAGVAGIYFVCTDPRYRGRGIGAAVTSVPLRDAHALGYRVGILGASSMGYPVYRRLGFRDYCTLGVYEWMTPNQERGNEC
jgi:GNAT superfamily N-acetyltransferase